VVLTAKAPGASQNGPIQLSLITTPVRAAAASLSGGGGTSYDTGTVTANVNGTSLTASYGQTSTAQTIAQSLASSINAGNLGVTALAGANGALAVTANQPGSAGDSIVVTLSSSTSDPGLFSSPSFTGTSATLSGGTDPVLSPGTIYSYAIPSPPAANAGYAGNGNLLSYTDSINGQWTAHYDTLNRLSTATVAGTSPATLAWSYDAFGNRKSQTPGGTTYSYPAANNRVSTFPYDASGDVLDDGRNQYGYDGEGRLCTVYNKTLLTYTGYVYDGMGNRVASGTGMSSLSCNNSFTPSKTFVTGPNGEQLDQLSGTGAVYSNVFANGQLLATYQYSGSNWTFALNDWLGTKRVVVNANGTQAEACTGYPFGDGMNCTGGDPSPQHFTGKVRDVESNNDYFGARYYSNNTGRFLIPDWSAKEEPVPYAALNNPQTLNLYPYVANNPLSRSDADGHCFPFCLALAGGAVLAEEAPLAAAGPVGWTVIGVTAVGVVGYSAYQHFNQDAATPAESAPTQTPQDRGRANEATGLAVVGADKNTKPTTTVDPKTGQTGTTIADGKHGDGQNVEVKDTKRVSDSKQLRLQNADSKASSGKASQVVTGEKTKVSSTVQENHEVIRTPSLGPQ
jgi:RHS repeat-associated protein